MTLKEHRKHSHIAKPAYGNFNRNEWAIIGTHSDAIERLADEIIKKLSPLYKCAYAGSDLQAPPAENMVSSRLAAGAITEYKARQNHYSLSHNKPFGRYEFRQMFSDADMVIVNGDLPEAKAQIIVIDPATEQMLRERLSLLTNVHLILLASPQAEIFDFIKKTIPAWHHLPIYRMEETGRIADFFIAQLKQVRPVLKGLVLAGGKSLRMGSDKGLIAWHGKEQRYYVADLLRNFCDEVFISCRTDQANEIDDGYPTIVDSFTGLGPYGAILSAFREQPDAAWFVVACDLPLLDAGSLQFLVEKRDQSKMATTFESPRDGVPEPLITIWEPKSYPILLSLLSQGYTCPKKALQSNDICMLKPAYPGALMNVNTPEEKEKAKSIIEKADRQII